jgi:probable F420-dependent oxidoreductase
MTATLQIGLSAPQVFLDDRVDMALVRDVAAGAEKFGFHSLWVQEQIVGTAPVLEPLGLLSYISGITSRVKLGTAVLIATQRNPVQLAKTLSSLDVVSGGRLIAGLALGGQAKDYPLFGASEQGRVSQLADTIGVLRALWSDGDATYSGQSVKLDGVAMEPKPVQRPGPPIWLGGRHPNALTRAAKIADGWIGAGSTSTDQFVEHASAVHAGLQAQGRDPTSFTVGKRVYVAVDNDASRAEQRLRGWTEGRYGSADLASRVAVWGSPEACAEGLARIAKAGARFLLIDLVFDQLEQMPVIAGQIAPALGADLTR